MFKMNKIVTFFLVALLCATMVFSVSAETGAAAKIGQTEYATLVAAVAAAQDGDEIVLLDNVDLGTEMLSIKKKVTLNLGGKTVTSAYEGGYASIYVGTAGDLTVTGEGAITNTAGVAIGNYGKLTIAGGEITGKDAALYNYYYNETTYGTATIAGGELNTVWNCGAMEVTGGTIAYLDNTHKLTVSGGTVTELVVKEADYNPINGTTTTVTGGEANVTAAAKVGNNYYVTLAEAVAAAQDGDEIVLHDNVDLGTEMLSIKKKVTINLGGKTITSAYEGGYASIYVGTAGDLTVTGEGAITNTAGVAIGNYGKLTISGGKITGEEAAVYNYYYNETTYGTAIIAGGELNTVWNCGVLEVTDGTIAYLDNTHALTITGGTVTELVVNEADYAPVNGTTTTISGGQFGVELAEEWLAPGFVAEKTVDDNGNTVYTVVAEEPAETGDPIFVVLLAAMFSGTGFVALTNKKRVK